MAKEASQQLESKEAVQKLVEESLVSLLPKIWLQQRSPVPDETMLVRFLRQIEFVQRKMTEWRVPKSPSEVHQFLMLWQVWSRAEAMLKDDEKVSSWLERKNALLQASPKALFEEGKGELVLTHMDALDLGMPF